MTSKFFQSTYIKVLAVHALAYVSAEDSRLKALAVLLEAAALLTVASFGVAGRGGAVGHHNAGCRCLRLATLGGYG